MIIIDQDKESAFVMGEGCCVEIQGNQIVAYSPCPNDEDDYWECGFYAIPGTVQTVFNDLVTALANGQKLFQMPPDTICKAFRHG